MKKMPNSKPQICPPAIADGVKTSADVKPFKRPRGQGPRKLKKGPVPKKIKRRRKWADPVPEDDKPKRPNHLPWTTKSRRILNEQKDRMLRRKRLSTTTKKRLEAANKRRMKRLRLRLHNLFNPD